MSHSRRLLGWRSVRLASILALAFFSNSVCSNVAAVEPIVPGTGQKLARCGDDFEDPEWSYRTNLPKSSYEQDERQRGPGGYSNNKLWHEGAKRGTPDIVKRVPTPAGGIKGSTGSILIATKFSGIPGRVTGKQQQDDLLMKIDRKLKRKISAAWQPSCVVRVYLPEFEQWENRTGSSFGIRIDARGKTPKQTIEPYWPGMFINFRSETSKKFEKDFAQISIRSNRRGHDIAGPKIMKPGWWTFGISITSDGQFHYYAKEGVKDLTPEDHLHSGFPYNYRMVQMNNFFFNVANWDNGRSWSTQWIIDDPAVYVIPPAGHTVAELYPVPRQKRTQTASRNNTSSSKATSNRSASSGRKQTSRHRHYKKR